MNKWHYTPHHFKHVEGHLFLGQETKGACTITLTPAAAMTQKQLDYYGRKIVPSYQQKIQMITLPLEFVSGEGSYSQAPGPLTYKQIDRKGKFAIYQRFYVDGRPKDYEVIVIRTIPKGTVSTFPAPKGQTEKITKVSADDQEHYPVTSSWGKMGWGFHGANALNGAKYKLGELQKEFVIEESGVEAPAKAIIIPPGKFTTRELAEKNGIEYQEAVFWIKANLNDKIVALGEERRAAKGPMSKVFGAKPA